MKLSIITPTIQRESLIRTCQSVNEQTFTDWQHIVMVDCPQMDIELLKKLTHPNRIFKLCDAPHKNFGNTCRHNAWEMATGEYILYLDDDNYLMDNKILEDIAPLLTGPWCLFPIFRHGSRFYNDPPRLCQTDTANFIVKKEFGRWLNITNYEADGLLVESLKQYPYRAFPNFRPIVNMPASNGGK